MTKCRMCSQVLYARRRLCQDCEWEIEAAQLATAPDPDTGPRAGVEDDAPPQSVPSADAMPPDASVSFNLWRTRRGARSTSLALVAALALAAAAGLHPGQLPTGASASVMDRVAPAAPAARTGRSGAAAGVQTATGAAAKAKTAIAR